MSGINGRFVWPQNMAIWKWSSIAWQNVLLMGSRYPITYAKNCKVCVCCPGNGHLEVLKYLREEGKAPWDWQTATWAARNGHLHILEYLVERKYDEYNEFACEYAAKYGHLDCLKYLRETAKAPWDSDAVREAREKNHPECVQYLLDNDCPLPEGWSYANGELHVPDYSESELHSESELDLFE